MFLGIDTGVSGGLALIDKQGCLLNYCFMPTYTFISGVKKTKKKKVDGKALKDLILHWSPEVIFIEEVHARPRDGKVSAFSFGHSLGVLEGMLKCIDIEYYLVRPQKWKKRNGLVGLEKDDCRILALEMNPELSIFAGNKIKAREKEGVTIADSYFIAREGLYIDEYRLEPESKNKKQTRKRK